jgi:glycosyltransferase involved in cell wall biosynthesis
MSSRPRLTIGLPVYNGENYLAESIESLLGQTYEDFELVISDNASTDGTSDICEAFRKRDSRIRYFRQERNIGLSPNHNFTVAKARGELFKWASHDDLYGRDLLKLCVEALDRYPDVVLAHSWTARIDGDSKVVKAEEYPLDTASPAAPARFRSTLFGNGGDDDGGVIRGEVLRRIAPYGSYYHADRTAMSELVLYGRFYQVPQWLFFRRDHAERAEWKFTDARSWCTNLDPKRAKAFRNPLIRLYAEYVWGYVGAIHRAPLTATERRACYGHVLDWLVNRLARGDHGEPPVEVATEIDIESLVAGRGSDRK